MKRRIIWSCTPKPYGYHLLATSKISGKKLDVNVAIDQTIWDNLTSRTEFLSVVCKRVAQTFDDIESYAPPGRTLH